MKRTAVTLVPVHSFLCTCTILILIQPKIYNFFSTLTHRVGVVGNFFLDLCESTLTVTSQNCLPICGFSLRQFGGFSRHILYIQYLGFFSDIKTLSARSGTTVQSRNFSFFCAELCMHLHYRLFYSTTVHVF